MSNPVNIVMNINVADAASFRRTQHQLLAQMTRTVARRRQVQAVVKDPELFAKPPPPFDWGPLWQKVKAVLAGKDDWK